MTVAKNVSVYTVQNLGETANVLSVLIGVEFQLKLKHIVALTDSLPRKKRMWLGIDEEKRGNPITDLNVEKRSVHTRPLVLGVYACMQKPEKAIIARVHAYASLQNRTDVAGRDELNLEKWRHGRICTCFSTTSHSFIAYGLQ